MLRLILVRPGSTEFDLQGRIKGTLDIPLAPEGKLQASQTAEDLASITIDAVYCSPCQSAQQTAELIASSRRLKVKVVDELRNIDHGLWHGKRVEEVKLNCPRIYRQGQDHPETICPPSGEPISLGRDRLRAVLPKLLKKQRSGVVCMVVPEPFHELLECELTQAELRDLWDNECDDGGWEIFEMIADPSLDALYRGVVQQTPAPVALRAALPTATAKVSS